MLARRHPEGLLSPDHGLDLVLGDLSDRGALQRLVRGADTIIHLAGVVKAFNAEQFFAINELGTERLLSAAADANPKAPLIHLSSLAAREPLLSPYAASKRAAECKVEALAGSRPWTILRPPAVYGPRDLELLPLFQAARRGLVLYPAAPDAVVSLIHGSDLGVAIAALADADFSGQSLFEIDDGKAGGYRWPDLLAALGSAFARPIRARRISRGIVTSLARANRVLALAQGQPRVFFPHKVPELYHPDWVVQGPKVGDRLSWRPRFDAKSGFADTASWYRRNRLLS